MHVREGQASEGTHAWMSSAGNSDTYSDDEFERSQSPSAPVFQSAYHDGGDVRRQDATGRCSERVGTSGHDPSILESRGDSRQSDGSLSSDAPEGGTVSKWAQTTSQADAGKTTAKQVVHDEDSASAAIYAFLGA